jgi:probable phosphoglycerate mutase
MPDHTTTTGEIRQQRFAPPPGATEVLLIRHGESAPLRPGATFPLVDGQADPELAPAGREQAERIAHRLAAERIAAIYVTPLRRTGDTAAPLAARLGLTPETEPALREIHLGEWEGGVFRRKVAENDPIAQRMLAEGRWDAIPGAESNEQLAKRVRGALEGIAASHPDRRVAVFTHGGVIAAAMALAAQSRPFAFLGADNGSISQLVIITGEDWVLRRYNDTAHLDHGLSADSVPLT